ncbi:MFS transporter [Alicyclobacillaceae bacterium I2511]|nr:MFS transporter [Alicyclobacillaceae bacterium I2511]
MDTLRRLDAVAKRLILMRGLRSVGQGAMVVDLTLYLKDLHWSAIAIGGVTSAAGLVGAALILLVGVLSDRLGRRPFLLIYEALTMLSAILASLTPKALVLIFAIVIAGFGRGQSGGAGPFSPAEQAWLARHVPQRDRGAVFSVNNAIAFTGMALGALIGGVPSLLHGLTPVADYRPVFLMVGGFSFLCMVILLQTPESPYPVRSQPESSTDQQVDREWLGQESSPTGTGFAEQMGRHPDLPSKSAQEREILRRENRAMLKLALVNTLNGLAVGLTGPMMAYWFSIRYGVSTGAIGVTLAVGFLVTGFFSLLSGVLAKRVGMVRSVTWMRVVGSLFMLALPWMPTFSLAAVLYVFRNAINRGTQGNRSALGASLTRDKRRGLATSINALSMRLPSSIGPTLTGYMFDAGWLALPLLLTASLQLVNAGIYQWVFGAMDHAQDVHNPVDQRLG